MLIDSNQSQISIARQCALLGVNRSSYYYHPKGESVENLALMRLVDEQYLQTPIYGYRQMTRWLHRQGYRVNRKRIQRLMGMMGIQGTVPGPHTSRPHPRHKIYPYLLKGMTLTHANLVWSTDLTYVPLPGGFMYLTAIIDWYSRYVVSWALSNTMDVESCAAVLDLALLQAEPVIFNTDQGSQFTSPIYTRRLLDRGILISMDGRGRALDNVFIERLWRSVKYEDIYIRDYQNVQELTRGLEAYFRFYNEQRPHSALGGKVPAEVHASMAVVQ
jgi:putative transposase